MKKKIALVLSVILMMCMLGACGTDPENVDYNGYSYSDLSQQAVENAFYISYLASNLGSTEVSDQEKEALMGYGITEAQLASYTTWNSVTEEFGPCSVFLDENFDPSMVDTSSFVVTKSGETLTTDLTLKFGEKDVIFQVVYDYFDMKITGYTIEPVYSLGEKMAKAGLNTIISLAIVFCVLILISLIIYCFNIFPYLEKKKKEKAMAAAPTPAAEAPVIAKTPAAEAPVTDDTELIAVIAAAIAASEGTSPDGFVVRSINRR